MVKFRRLIARFVEHGYIRPRTDDATLASKVLSNPHRPTVAQIDVIGEAALAMGHFSVGEPLGCAVHLSRDIAEFARPVRNLIKCGLGIEPIRQMHF